MPIFEYACKECGAEFDALVQGAATVACPSCESAELKKKLSSFCRRWSRCQRARANRTVWYLRRPARCRCLRSRQLRRLYGCDAN